MKGLLYILLFIVCFTPKVNARQSYEYATTGTGCTSSVWVYPVSNDNTGQVKSLAENGSICKVYGHRWGDTTIEWSISDGEICLGEVRVCELCGKKQSKEKIIKWVDVK